MKLVVLRGEDPPAHAVVVVRGGRNGLDPMTVTRTATRSLDAMGFLGVSVFLALDGTVAELCNSLNELAPVPSGPQVDGRRGEGGRLRLPGDGRSAPLRHCPSRPRRIDAGTPRCRVRCAGAEPRTAAMSVVKPGQWRDNGWMEPRPWQMWVDFGRVYSGLTYGHIDDAAPGTEIAPGRYLIVGDDDADPAVAQVVEVKDDGTVLLRVLPGHAKQHATLVSPQPA